ncbi:hypothetical protein QZH41_015587, partial [Actinostola sp. cb2023]
RRKMVRTCPICGKSQKNLYTHLSRTHKLDNLQRKYWIGQEQMQKSGQRFTPYPRTHNVEDTKCDRFQLRHPFTAIVAGMTGSGKTVWVQNLLQHASEVIQPPPQRIVWSYSQWQPAYEQMQQTLPGIEFVKGIPHDLDEDWYFDPKVNNLIVIDDQMAETSNDQRILNLFTKGSHHRNLSVIFLCQNVYFQGKIMRTLSLNAAYLVLFKNPRDKLQITTLGKQMYPGKTDQFLHKYEAAVERPYGYLFVDLKPNTPEECRLRTNVLPNDPPQTGGQLDAMKTIAPGLSWDAMLKMTQIRLELLSDVDMLLMVEKGIRGGVSMITKRVAPIARRVPFGSRTFGVEQVGKLVPTTRNRTQYVVHHHTLKLYESLGMKIIKIHRGINVFHESDWLKKYIHLNTELRTAAKNDFEKDFFKLMNNSVFGKTMENIRNRQDIKLVSTEKQAAKLVAQPNFYRRTIFSEHLCAVHMRKTELVFNKPVYLGMSILDLSKSLMYDFHYNYFKKKFKTSELLFTDTDSLMYEIQTGDFYRDIQEDVLERFDTSAYSKEHPIGVWVNKKVIGKMKDETAVEGEITEFVGLRSKLYAYKTEEKEEKKCKGIKRSVVKKDLDFEDYKTCLFSGVKVMRKMNVIRSYKHQLFSETVHKVALSREDDKRIILADQIHTHSI